jgi:hypothetical protein
MQLFGQECLRPMQGFLLALDERGQQANDGGRKGKGDKSYPVRGAVDPQCGSQARRPAAMDDAPPGGRQEKHVAREHRQRRGNGARLPSAHVRRDGNGRQKDTEERVLLDIGNLHRQQHGNADQQRGHNVPADKAPAGERRDRVQANHGWSATSAAESGALRNVNPDLPPASHPSTVVIEAEAIVVR